jgi:CheY-like chemotaxis protein
MKQRVLVIDDDINQRKLMADLLKPLGFGFLQAADGKTGLGILANNHVDIVLLDVRMPEMDGWTVVKKIRQQSFNMPVLMISANARDAEPNLTTKRYHNGYLAKPIDLDTLLGKLGELLPIQWHYSDQQTQQNTEIIDSDKPDVGPEQYQALMALAEIGYLSGFKEKLNEISEQFNIPADIMSQLSEYVTLCNFPEIIKYLEEICHEQ